MPKTLLSALLALALVTPGHAAAPVASVTDPRGDWPVASQDILSARLSSVYVHGVPTLRAEVDLAAAPNPLVPTTYTVDFGVGCAAYSLTSDGTSGTLERSDCKVKKLTTSAPGTAAVHGTTLVIQAPYALGLQVGQVAQGLGAVAATVFVAYWQLTGDFATSGDIALAPYDTTYVLGSDLHH